MLWILAFGGLAALAYVVFRLWRMVAAAQSRGRVQRGRAGRQILENIRAPSEQLGGARPPAPLVPDFSRL